MRELDLERAKARLQEALKGEAPPAVEVKCCEPTNGWGHTLKCLKRQEEAFGGVHLFAPKKERWSEYEILLGVPRTTVELGETALIYAQPQLGFRMTRLALSPACAPHFSILDVTMGQCSSLLAPVPIPGSMFANAPWPWNAEQVNVPFAPPSPEVVKAIDRLGRLFPGTCYVGSTIRLMVRNEGNCRMLFEGAFYGNHLLER
jgi:hypothetical protein